MKLKAWLSLQKQDLDERIRSYPRFRALLLLAAVFSFFVSVFWLWQKTFSAEVEFYDWLIMDFILQTKTPWWTTFFSLATWLGSELVIALAFVVLILVLAVQRRRRAAAAASLSLAGSGLLVLFLKNFFGRQRPLGCLPGGDCLAFPSGHTTFAFYFYGLLVYLTWRFLPLSLKKFLSVALMMTVVIFLVALSRLVLGVHYPSDILAGFFLGGSGLLLAIFLIDVLY